MANKNPISDAFETINQSSGGVAGQVATGLKSAAAAASVDVARGVVKTPAEMIKDVMGDGEGASPNELAGAGGGGDGGGSDSDMIKKVEADRKKVSERLRQQRLVFAEEREQFERSKQMKAEEKQQGEAQKEQKKAEIKQLKVRKRQESLVVVNAKQMGGSHEMQRKKF